MKIAEVIKKRSTQIILLTFDDMDLIYKLEYLSGFMYHSSLHQYYCNIENIDKLKELNFIIVYDLTRINLKIDISFLGNNYVHIYGADIYQYKIMRKFTVLDYSKCYVYNKFNKQKVTKKEFFVRKRDKILVPIGLKDLLKINYSDLRKRKRFNFSSKQIKNCLGYLSLYDFQITVIKKCLYENGIIDVTGGGGKTECFLALCKLTKLKILIITERIALCQQTYQRAKNANLDVGIIQGNNLDEKHQIIICTIQSSHKLQEQYEAVIIDECHLISPVYEKILCKQQIKYRWGFSATPFEKTDKLKKLYIQQWLGSILYRNDTQDFINNSIIAEPIINILEITKPTLSDGLLWRDIEKLGIIYNIERNQKIVELCLSFKKQTLILVKKREHGHILVELFNSEHKKAIFIDGLTSKADRKKIINIFEKNKNEFIFIGCQILKEGISINAIFNLILAGGGSSYYDTLQMLFRGTRVKLKNSFNVYDFLDSFNRITLKHSNKRISMYQEKGFTKIKYFRK